MPAAAKYEQKQSPRIFQLVCLHGESGPPIQEAGGTSARGSPPPCPQTTASASLGAGPASGPGRAPQRRRERLWEKRFQKGNERPVRESGERDVRGTPLRIPRSGKEEGMPPQPAGRRQAVPPSPWRGAGERMSPKMAAAPALEQSVTEGLHPACGRDPRWRSL